MTEQRMEARRKMVLVAIIAVLVFLGGVMLLTSGGEKTARIGALKAPDTVSY